MSKIYACFWRILCISLPFTAPATPIDSLRASQAAANFLKTHVRQFSGIDFAYKSPKTQQPATYYVFNHKNKDGFVIIIADDACYPVLGYSTETGFDSAKQPVQLVKMLWNWNHEITYVRQQGFKASATIKQAWTTLEQGITATARVGVATSVAPLVTTRWDQSPYYNALCPYDARAGQADGSRAVTGCVATAMAQIMKYHNHPKTGQVFPPTHTVRMGS